MTVATVTIHADGSAKSVPITIASKPPSTAPVARFCRFNYNSTQTVADGSRYALIDIGYGTSASSQASIRALLASLRQAYPSIELLMYTSGVSIANDPTGIGSEVTWTGTYPTSLPDSWFLHDTSGNKIVNPSAGSQVPEYFLDPASTGLQQAAINHVIPQALNAGYTGIFTDVSDAAGLHWIGGGNGIAPGVGSIASDAAWQAAVVSCIKALTTAAHASGLKVYGNIGGAFSKWQVAWSQFLGAGLDGAMEESFTSGTNGLPVPLAQWQQTLQNLVWAEAHGKTTLCNADVHSNQALNVYGLCSMLLGSNGLACWDTSSGSYGSGEYWFPEYDAALKLGAPSGAYVVQSNGLYVRRFANGTVVVNPTTSAITDPVYGTVAATSGALH